MTSINSNSTSTSTSNSNSNSNVKLKKLLKDRLPELSDAIVDNFVGFVDRYDLTWFCDTDSDKGIYFLMNDLAKIDNINPKSVITAWTRYEAKTTIKNAPLPPIYYGLRGEALTNLKKSQPHLNIDPFCRVVTVCNWVLIYAFKIDPTFLISSAPPIKYFHLSEEEIQLQLFLLSGYSRNPFCLEYMIDDLISDVIRKLFQHQLLSNLLDLIARSLHFYSQFHIYNKLGFIQF